MSDARGLAEGVAALVEPFAATGAELQIVHLAPDVIDANPAQPRRSFSAEAHQTLTASVARHGVLQPVLVREAAIPGRYELVAGERRLRAARSLRLESIPAIVAAIPDERLLEVALVENLQRCSLNPIEEAEAFRSLIDRYHYTQESVAERVGKSRSTVANALRLLELPDGVKRVVAARQLSAGHARALAGLHSAEDQEALCERILREGMSVRDTEAEVQRIKRAAGSGRRTNGPRPPYMNQLEHRLQRVLGTRVRLVHTGRDRGRIVIDYHSDAEFERLLGYFS